LGRRKEQGALTEKVVSEMLRERDDRLICRNTKLSSGGKRMSSSKRNEVWWRRAANESERRPIRTSARLSRSCLGVMPVANEEGLRLTTLTAIAEMHDPALRKFDPQGRILSRRFQRKYPIPNPTKPPHPRRTVTSISSSTADLGVRVTRAHRRRMWARISL